MDIPEQYLEMAAAYGLRIIAVAAIFIIGRMIIRWVNRLVIKASVRKEIDSTLKSFLSSIISTLLNIMLLLTMASTLGIQITSFIAILGAAGLAIGLALQGSLSNFAGGVLILMFRPFSVGDFIDAQGILGSVIDIKVLYTTLNTPDNRQVIIPNGNLANNTITNFSRNPTRRLEFVFGISYDDSIDQAKEIISGLIEENEIFLKDPAPMIGVSAHNDSSIDITVRVWVERVNFLTGTYFLNEAVKKAFDEADITIPFPQRDVHLYSHTAEQKI